VIARSAKDVILFDEIFSDCDISKPEIKLKGMRIGYPTNLWKGLDAKVGSTSHTCQIRISPLFTAVSAGHNLL